MYIEKLGINVWIKLKYFSLLRYKLCDENNGVFFNRIVGDLCICYK